MVEEEVSNFEVIIEAKAAFLDSSSSTGRFECFVFVLLASLAEKESEPSEPLKDDEEGERDRFRLDFFAGFLFTPLSPLSPLALRWAAKCF